MLLFIIWQATRPSEAESKEKWEHYNNLVDLIIRTETEPYEKRGQYRHGRWTRRIKKEMRLRLLSIPQYSREGG